MRRIRYTHNDYQNVITMHVEIKNEPTIVIELKVKEAEWLRAFIQNHPDTSSESEGDRNIRTGLFYALRDALLMPKSPANETQI